MKVAVIAGYAGSLLNFRGPLLRAMVEAGHSVCACAPAADVLTRLATSDVPQRLAAMGVDYRSFPMQRTGLNPLRDLASFFALQRLMRAMRPDVVLTYTAKAVIYGSLAARLAGVRRCYAMITGITSDLLEDAETSSLRRRILSALYRLALRCNRGVLFQNPDDRALFERLGLLSRRTQTFLINGSGVDLEHYAVAPPVVQPPVFLLIARLVRDKGVREYVDAARILKALYPQVSFRLLGPLEPGHPLAIPAEELRRWQEEGSIEYLGQVSDVRPHIAACSVYVLPSYHEGTPRTVLEAMSMGRPIVTSDAPGCRETVLEGENGTLVPPRNALALARALKQFVVNPELIARMGRRSRQIAEEKYDVHRVNQQIMEALELQHVS